MSFNSDLVRGALYFALSTKNVGDQMKFPDGDPVFSNGALVSDAPSIGNVTGIPIATYELRSRFIFMKYAFTIEALTSVGLGTDELFQDKIKRNFMQGLQEYLLTLYVPETVYKSPSLNDVTFEFNNIAGGGTPTKVARAYVNIRYWFKLP